MFIRRIIDYFYQHRIILSLTFIYSAAIIVISLSHVVWRDEVHALTTVMESQSIVQLFQNLHNQGHPFLWYLILYIGFQLTHSMLILKIAAILIAISAVYLFLLKSPFNLLQKTLFIFGFLPIYQYSIYCRGYGVSMLLLFLFCSLYQQRFSNIILLSGVLFLLANSEPHALIITIAIFLSMAAEFIVKRKGIIKDKNSKGKIIVGFSIILLGILSSVVQMIPDQSTAVTHMYHLKLPFILKEILHAVLWPWQSFKGILGVPLVPIFIIILLIYLYLLKNVYLFGIFFLSIVGLTLMHHLVYPLKVYHQGFLYLLIIAAFWIDQTEGGRIETGISVLNKVITFLSKHKNILLYLLLISQIGMGYQAVSDELKSPRSSSKNFGEFLNARKEFKNAIIISEPDYVMESVVYYANHQIYIPRESRFGKNVSLTVDNKSSYSLKELLETALKLKADYHRPVLIGIGFHLSSEGPFRKSLVFGKFFTYSKDQLTIFLDSTTKVIGFHGVRTDESYDVFLLK